MCPFARGGQLDGERRALAWLTVDGDPTVVGPHGFLDDRQTKASPSAGLFRGEKRLKYLR